MVIEAVESNITPDSAAEVSVVTTKLLRALSDTSTWLAQQEFSNSAAMTGIGKKSVPVKSKVKMDLRFATPGGPLVLHNVVFWVTDHSLPPGVDDLLLSQLIMKRLGYSSENRLADGQQLQPEWDMSDIDDIRTNSVPSIQAYAGAVESPQRAEQKLILEEDEDRACFPTFENDADAEREKFRAILLEKDEEVRELGASLEFVNELGTILMQLIYIFKLIIGHDLSSRCHL
ncbi:hypothetical protein PHMEG_00029562 [Phytophthora megakarya]|uniref:Uncharacterized protein n=1 Tax=Phytophthora megakarya TaxID=4795 RepID=A0A225V2U1_9STRA|nr:hypothetical protein PHMEG_00029562 [Phytophthora megakarya]